MDTNCNELSSIYVIAASLRRTEMEFVIRNWWAIDPEDIVWEAQGEDVKIVINGGPMSATDSDGNKLWALDVELPHQCDAWEIAYGFTNDVETVKKDFDAFIADLQKARAFMDTPEFAAKIKEVQDV